MPVGWSGLIYAAIVAGWAAVLVPRWVRRNEEAERAKAADALAGVRLIERRDRSQAGAVMAPRQAGRTTGAPRRHVLHAPHPPVPDLPPRVAAVAWDETGSARLPRLRTVPPAAASRESRRSAAARRRRVLALLSAVLVIGLAAVLVGAVPAVALLLPGLLLAGFVVLARVAVRREAASGRQSRSRSQAVPRPYEAGPAVTGGHSGSDGVAPSPWVRRAPEAEVPRLLSSVAERADETDDGSWEPVPVPLPTYVTAPKAPRVIRRIDLSTSGAWTAATPATVSGTGPAQQGHERQDLGAAAFPPLPPLVAADTADEHEQDEQEEGYEHRRAVGD